MVKSSMVKGLPESSLFHWLQSVNPMVASSAAHWAPAAEPHAVPSAVADWVPHPSSGFSRGASRSGGRRASDAYLSDCRPLPHATTGVTTATETAAGAAAAGNLPNWGVASEKRGGSARAADTLGADTDR
jgi:hypothetical protein